MFDNVGRDVDAEGGRRRIAALLLTLGVSASVALLGFGIVAWQAARMVIEEVADDDMPDVIEVTVAGEDDLVAPPPPIALARATVAPRPEVPPDEPTDEVQPLPEPQDLNVENATGGSPDGLADGDPDGAVDGVPGGVADSDGRGGDGVVVLHHTEVEVLRSPTPVYPRAAIDMGFDEVACRATVFIAEDGKPYDVRMDAACPAPFVESSEEALFRWRWAPARVDGKPVRAQFLMVLKYIPDRG